MSSDLLVSAGALRQYRHNSGDGLVAGYDLEVTELVVSTLQSKNADLEAQISRFLQPGPQFAPTASEMYPGLLRQFRAAINIINSKNAQLQIYAEKNYQLDRDKHLASIEMLESEKNMNAKLTEDLEELEQKFEKLKAKDETHNHITLIGYTNGAQIRYAKSESHGGQGSFYIDQDNNCTIPVYMLKTHHFRIETSTNGMVTIDMAGIENE